MTETGSWKFNSVQIDIYIYLLITFLLLLLLFLLIFILYAISILLGLNYFLTKEESSSFECGFDSFNNARFPYCIRFFITILIFLLFDIELVLLLPCVIYYYSFFEAELISFLFVYTLILGGFFYEWAQGSLDWF